MTLDVIIKKKNATAKSINDFQLCNDIIAKTRHIFGSLTN